MLISEIYLSRQGEGRLTGTPSVFIRTSGCNLRCDFCDTPFTSWNPGGSQRSVDQIVSEVLRVCEDRLPARIDTEETIEDRARHVVLTGGEPMIAREVESLCEKLSVAGFHITIETAGTMEKNLHCDLISISPKLSNSTPSEERAGKWSAKHEGMRYQPGVSAALISRHDWQLKFVVERRADVDEIERYLADVQRHREGGKALDPGKVLLMPEGVDAETLTMRSAWLKPLCDSKGFNFCQRQHIFWYGNQRAT